MPERAYLEAARIVRDAAAQLQELMRRQPHSPVPSFLELGTLSVTFDLIARGLISRDEELRRHEERTAGSGAPPERA
jgi:hypothetical protein